MDRHWMIALAAVAAVALGFRLICLWQLHVQPMSHWLIGDARAYDAWGRRIAAGDWLGSGVFYQAPLYPYFLGATYAIAGHDLLAVRLLQVLWGTLGCVLLAMAAKALFNRQAGLLAGLMLAGYPAAVFFDVMIQKSALDLPLLSLSLWLLVMGRQRGAWRWWIIGGATLGLLMLSRENALVFVAVAGLWALWPAEGLRNHWRMGLARAAMLLAGLVIVLLPVAVRNAAVGGEFHLTTSQFGPNFYIGNNHLADGTYKPLRFGRGDALYERADATELAQQQTGRPLTPGEVSAYWTGQALGFIRQQPAAYAKLLLRKTMMTLNAVEIADTEDLYGWSDFAAILRLMAWWNMGLLLPLAGAGAALTIHRWRELWLVHVGLALYTLSVIAFYVFARYRLPMVPMLIILAAGGLAMLPAVVRDKRWKLLGCAMGLAAVSAVVANQRTLHPKDQQRAITYLTFAQGAMQQDPPRMDLAEKFYFRAIELTPAHAASYYSYAMLLKQQGRLAEAQAELTRAVEWNPRFAEAWNQLGLLRQQQGDRPAAGMCYLRAIHADPHHAAAHNNLGILLAGAGQLDKAVEHYRLAIQADPMMAQAYNNLGTALARLGHLDEAIQALEQALKIDPDYPDAQANLQRARGMKQ